jgi:hypothetical protein
LALFFKIIPFPLSFFLSPFFSFPFWLPAGYLLTCLPAAYLLVTCCWLPAAGCLLVLTCRLRADCLLLVTCWLPNSFQLLACW